MRLIDADEIVYESIDSSDTARHEHYYGTGILAVRKEDIDAMPTVEPERKKMSNKEWVDFLSEQFTVSRTSARDMLHALMTIKRYDNFKRTFDPLPEPYKEGEG